MPETVAPGPIGLPDPARRSDRAYRAILDAAKGLLEEHGFAAISVDQIAKRAGVGKQTIYRWWPNKAAVVLEAHGEQAAAHVPVPDTGSIRGDLRRIAEDFANTLANTAAGRVCIELIGEAQHDADFAEAYREIFVTARRAVVLEVLRRGRDRGEVRHDIDLEYATDMLFGPIWYRGLTQHAPLTRTFARAAADMLTDAIVLVD